MSMGSPGSSLEHAAADESSENTKRWQTDPQLLLTERRRAETERSDLRQRPASGLSGSRAEPRASTAASGARAVAPQPVDVQRVRGLYEQFLRVVGPAAKLIFEHELRQLGVRPSTMTERDYAMLAQRLTLRVPDPGVRKQFKAQALIEPWP
jgi:hypothetical protein